MADKIMVTDRLCGHSGGSFPAQQQSSSYNAMATRERLRTSV